MKKAHWFIIFLLFAISCLDEPDCFRLNNNVIGIAFKKMYDGKADTVAVIGVDAVGAIDTTFSAYTYTNGIYVPLDFFNTQTAFTLAGLYETHHLLFGYDVKTQFVSEDCGARYVLTNLSLLEQDYDSIQMVGTTPSSSQAGVHLQVYRCPRTNLMKLTFRQLQGETSAVLAPKIEGIVPDYSGAIFIDTTLSAVNLPLNPGAGVTSVRYDFNFRDYESKFVTVNYRSDDWDYEPKYCGSRHLKLYKELSVGDKGVAFDFDSLIVVKDSLQDPPVTNITAYRCPDIGFMRVSFRLPSAVTADSLDVVKLTDNKGTVFYENVKLSAFTLPLISDTGITSTEFTFELNGGTTKKLKIDYIQDSKQVFQACGVQTAFTTLSIESTDFSSQPGTPTATPKVDHTTFPISTNFEIIK